MLIKYEGFFGWTFIALSKIRTNPNRKQKNLGIKYFPSTKEAVRLVTVMDCINSLSQKNDI